MVMALLFIVVMALLFKYSDIDKWWLWFAVITFLLAQWGYEFRIVGFMVVLGIFKVVKDIASQFQ